MLSTLRNTAALALMLAGPAIASFAITPAIGDGKGKKPSRTLQLDREAGVSSVFSLKSRYNYRGKQIINPDKEQQFINLNTVVTYQKGKTTYIIPLKKKVYINSGSGSGFGINVNH